MPRAAATASGFDPMIEISRSPWSMFAFTNPPPPCGKNANSASSVSNHRRAYA